MVASSHFDDLICLSEAWQRLPSQLTAYYMPELAAHHGVRPADWFAFDIAATTRLGEIQQERDERRRKDKARQGRAVSGGGKDASSTPSVESSPAARAGQSSAVLLDNASTGELHIVGTEIPPWRRR